jgi:osmotically-inducible protein OsmY
LIQTVKLLLRIKAGRSHLHSKQDIFNFNKAIKKMVMAQKTIKETIEDQFIWDDRILSANINIEVHDGTVRLTGEVPNFSGKVAAEEDARSVTGVKNVENELRVTYPDAIVVPEDEQIKKFLEDLISLDDRLNSANIHVKVDNGIVTYGGVLDSKWKKDVVLGYAYRIAGVREVISNLSVNPKGRKPDEKIQQEIEKAFKRNSILESEEIKVSVKNGAVSLSGTSSTHLARLSAGDIANYTSGVTEVINEVHVKPKQS